MKSPQPSSQRPQRILIAEDSPTQSAQLQYLLEQQGYQVVAAINGNEAIQFARRQKPDLVISDVDMPLMDGYGMCTALKQDAKLRNVPVILLTSLNDVGDVVNGLEAGADYYITKPYQSDYFLLRVREVLANPPRDVPTDTGPPIEFVVNGKTQAIAADRRQVLTLLLSTYSDAVQRNKELIESQRQLHRKNQLLDEAAQSERRAHEALKETQSQLVQSEKMASLGQMVAGVAHEINNPLAFVSNNVAILQRDLALLQEILGLYKQAEAGLVQRADLLDPITELAQRIDLPYTIRNLSDVLERSHEGMRRIQQIVLDLRDFARLDENTVKDADLNPGIQSTVNIVHAKARDRQVQLELDLRPLPRISCYPAKINQVIMNLVTNAIDASPPQSKIVIRSTAVDDGVRIEVIDSGSGIDPAIRGKIFDPFFTTKPPGKGTGLGLSISYRIITDHGGRIDVKSEPGAGSHFTVYLPLHHQDAQVNSPASSPPA